MSRSQQETMNNFLRKYSNLSFKHTLNAIFLTKKESDILDRHNLMICKICYYLLKHNIPFYTEFRMRDTNLRPDIVCPTHIKKIIEVFDTETIEKFNKDKLPFYPLELKEEFIFVNANQEFNEKLIL